MFKISFLKTSRLFIGWLLCLLFFTCKKSVETPPIEPFSSILQLTSISVGTQKFDLVGENNHVELDAPIVIRFANALIRTSVAQSLSLEDQAGNFIELEVNFLDNDKTISLKPEGNLSPATTYTLKISDDLKGQHASVFSGMEVQFTTLIPPLKILNIKIDGQTLSSNGQVEDIGFTPSIELTFSVAVKPSQLAAATEIVLGSLNYDIDIQQVTDSILVIELNQALTHYYRKHRLIIDASLGDAIGKSFAGLNLPFFTQLDATPKFPMISNDALLTKVQKQSFKYFWDFGHPVSGLARERNTSFETVTSGGSGFGLMAIIVGIERGFISRTEGIQRFHKIVDFLVKADRFHGVWSHWLNGSNGKVIPFSTKDDGGDLVETSYLAMGLLAVRQYLDTQQEQERQLFNKINELWESIEWNWHTQNGQQVLYWHWSPNFNWEKNLKISGYNEALITYILAVSSPTFPIDASVYHEGWARNGKIKNGQTFYEISLPLGNQSYGGPLFFEHYTFLGIDPRNLSDNYANYWEQAVNHSLINRAYCMDNPKKYIGYHAACWGLTASDGNRGYSAHSPTNDRGVITPTAALSSFPYTPDYSMDALHHFYYQLGDRLWKEYGFVDAFNITDEWTANSFLAIDQGPIIIMIENYRTGLLWDLVMSAPEIQNGLKKLGFEY
jgi:hypothetical protein